ncbi:HV330 protein, partial [Amia calva]|nr:HV330 protein [Amia calva]
MTERNMHWLRQPPGKGLEWIGRVNSGSGKQPDYAESIKGQIVLTEDVPSNTQHLEVESLKVQDTAVYYCACAWQGEDAFEYWGKGTQVTVTSGKN